MLQYEVIKLGTLGKTQNINLGVQCTSSEKGTFIKLLKEYKDVFAWSY